MNQYQTKFAEEQEIKQTKQGYNTVEETEDDGYTCSKAWSGYKACIVAVAHVFLI